MLEPENRKDFRGLRRVVYAKWARRKGIGWRLDVPHPHFDCNHRSEIHGTFEKKICEEITTRRGGTHADVQSFKTVEIK